VFLLIANLGAGKTTFAQGFIKALGVKEGALSPTFVLAQTYQGRVPVHHLDFYRATPAELVEAGVQDYLAGQGELPSGVVLIEWADRCRDLWPKDRVEVRIKISPQNQKRVFQIQGRGRRGETLVQGLG
jgi:tRNA threonylcarbamoyladenosine biosynthesis protein TsaE